MQQNSFAFKSTMSKKDLYWANVAVMKKSMIAASIAAGALLVLMCILFPIDIAANGTSKSWAVTEMLFTLTIVVIFAAAVFVLFVFLFGFVNVGTTSARDKTAFAERNYEVEQKVMTITDCTGVKAVYKWDTMRIIYSGKKLLVMRDNYAHMLVIPKTDITEEQIESVREIIRSALYKEHYKHKQNGATPAAENGTSVAGAKKLQPPSDEGSETADETQTQTDSDGESENN